MKFEVSYYDDVSTGEILCECSYEGDVIRGKMFKGTRTEKEVKMLLAYQCFQVVFNRFMKQ